METQPFGKTLDDYQPSPLKTSVLVDLRGASNTTTRDDVFFPKADFDTVRTTRGGDTEPTEPRSDLAKYPPFFATLTQGTVTPPAPAPPYDELRLRMVQGYIHIQRVTENGALDYMEEVVVSGIPVLGSEIVVEVGHKCWVVADEDENGIILNASFGSGTTPPVSVPPKLSAGDDTLGEGGQRTWVLCEIVEMEVDNSPDPNTFYPQVLMHRTGIIEHFEPRKVENTVNPASTNEARILKESLKEDGTYRLRVIRGKRGLTMEEGIAPNDDYAFAGLPEGIQGDVLYYSGDALTGEWVRLAAPTSPVANKVNTLVFDDALQKPEWDDVQPLPEGVLGDILYHDGTSWVVLNAPVSAALHVLTSTGGAPSWTATEECS